MKRPVPCTLLLATLLLSACLPATGNRPASQVIATVGNQEVTVLQFNHALKLVGLPQASPLVRDEITRKLVDRELIIQQAQAQGLDHDPEVLLQMEEARRDALARAYAERTATAASAGPSDAEVARYYATHPALFAERHIFHLHEITIPANQPGLDQVKRYLIQAPAMNNLSGWLQKQKVSFNEQKAMRAAEQIPLEALPRINGAPQGQTILFETPRGIIVYAVQSALQAPINWQQARPIIRDYLAKRAGRQTLEAHLEQLRSQTSIVYSEAFTPAGEPKAVGKTPS